MLDTTVPLLLKGLWGTVFMIFTSGFFGFLLGMPAGIVLFLTRKGQLLEHRTWHRVLSALINMFRSIPNDPTNGGRALLLLQKNGILKLREGVGLLPKVIDITENPKQLKIVEIEAPQLPRVLDDSQVTVAIINNNFAAQAGLDAATLGILQEEKTSPYVNVIASREDNKDQEKVKNFVKAYQSVVVVKAAEKVFRGGAVRGW